MWKSIDNAQISVRPQFVPAGFKSTPIHKDGTYISTSLGNIAAIDGMTGEQQWTFDTGTWKHGTPANMGFNHRGVSYWAQDEKQRILMATNNVLWSIVAETGQPDMSFGNNGKVDLTLGLGRGRSLTVFNTAAPSIVDNTIIIGGVVQDSPMLGLEVPAKQSDLPPATYEVLMLTRAKRIGFFILSSGRRIGQRNLGRQ